MTELGKAMAAKGLSDRDVADAAEVAISTVNRARNGRMGLRKRTAEKIAAVVGGRWELLIEPVEAAA